MSEPVDRGAPDSVLERNLRLLLTRSHVPVAPRESFRVALRRELLAQALRRYGRAPRTERPWWRRPIPLVVAAVAAGLVAWVALFSYLMAEEAREGACNAIVVAGGVAVRSADGAWEAVKAAPGSASVDLGHVELPLEVATPQGLQVGLSLLGGRLELGGRSQLSLAAGHEVTLDSGSLQAELAAGRSLRVSTYAGAIELEGARVRLAYESDPGWTGIVQVELESGLARVEDRPGWLGLAAGSRVRLADGRVLREPGPTTVADAGVDRTAVGAGTGLGALERAVTQLVERTERLERLIEERGARSAAPASGRLALDQFDAEVARALERRSAASGDALAGPPAARRAVEQAFQRLISGELSQEQCQSLWTEISRKGLSDALVVEFEARVEREPDDPDLHVDLGEAYLQKIFEAGGSSPTAGLWATKADGAFDAALALDETHWEARFTKAISYSFWPPALGMQNKSIAQFEILLEQQKGQPPSPQYAQTYYFLGNMYQQTGQPEKALRVWQQGLALYPGDEQLQNQVALAQGGG